MCVYVQCKTVIYAVGRRSQSIFFLQFFLFFFLPLSVSSTTIGICVCVPRARMHTTERDSFAIIESSGPLVLSFLWLPTDPRAGKRVMRAAQTRHSNCEGGRRINSFIIVYRPPWLSVAGTRLPRGHSEFRLLAANFHQFRFRSIDYEIRTQKACWNRF